MSWRIQEEDAANQESKKLTRPKRDRRQPEVNTSYRNHIVSFTLFSTYRQSLRDKGFRPSRDLGTFLYYGGIRNNRTMQVIVWIKTTFPRSGDAMKLSKPCIN